MGADKVRNAVSHRRRRAVRRRQLLPDAHRRHPAPPGRTDMRALHTRGDPRRSTEEEPCVMSGTYLGMPSFPKAAHEAVAQRDPARQSAPRHPHHPRQAGQGGRGARRLGAAARGRQADQGPHAPPSRPLPGAVGGVGHRGRRHRALGRRRRRGQPDRHATWSRRPARREVVKVKSMATQEIGLNEALGSRGHRRLRDRSRRTDRAVRRRPALAHPRPGDPPQPRRDPRHLRHARWASGAARPPRA